MHKNRYVCANALWSMLVCVCEDMSCEGENMHFIIVNNSPTSDIEGAHGEGRTLFIHEIDLSLLAAAHRQRAGTVHTTLSSFVMVLPLRTYYAPGMAHIHIYGFASQNFSFSFHFFFYYYLFNGLINNRIRMCWSLAFQPFHFGGSAHTRARASRHVFVARTHS